MATLKQITARAACAHLRVILSGEAIAALDPSVPSGPAWAIQSGVSEAVFATVRRWGAIDIHGALTSHGAEILAHFRGTPILRERLGAAARIARAMMDEVVTESPTTGLADFIRNFFGVEQAL